MNPINAPISRRHFLRATAYVGGGLTICLALPSCKESSAEFNGSSELLPFVTITSENKVIIPSVMSEMGQNVYTSLPQIVADELDADWNNVEIVQAEANEARYGFQGTWASLSIYTAWKSHRKAGATARDMLRAAAAQMWGIEKKDCITRNGRVLNEQTGRSASYGELASSAAKLPIPENVALKAPSDFHIIGKSMPRRDNLDKVSGTAVFGVDVKQENLKIAALLKPPVYGAKVKSLNDQAARAANGVSKVIQISAGIAVIADNYWHAEKAVSLLEVDWDTGPNATLSDKSLADQLRSNLENTSVQLNQIKGTPTPINQKTKKLSANYDLPLLAHATMEPVNFTAHVTSDSCQLWGPTQDGNAVKAAAAQHLKISEKSVSVTPTFVGGGFGRKADLDFVIDTLEVAQKLNGPVKVIWSRENDIKACIFRPATAHKLSAEASEGGKISNWQHLVAGHAAKGQEWLPTAGAGHIPYKVNGFDARAHVLETPIPVGTLRGIAHSSTNFANEIFIDELAEAAGQDALEFRLNMLKHEPRAQHALQLVAEKAGWLNHRDRNVYQGIALFDKPEEYANFFIAQIVEVSKSDDNMITIDRVVCAADFGQPINPDGIIAQVEGGIAYGLSMALYGEITIENGEVQQSNFHDYQVLRIPQMPEVEVYVIENNEYPRGCGEHINPATLPALANAVSSALRQRIRKLPLQLPT